MDIAGVQYIIDASGAEAGAKRGISAIEQLEKRTDQFLQRVLALQKQLAAALKFPGIGGGGSGTSPTSTGPAISAAERLAKAQQKAADEAFKHAQALARLQRTQGDTAASIRTLESALNRGGVSLSRFAAGQAQLNRLQASQQITRYASTIREAGESIQQAGFSLLFFSTALIGLGTASVKSAFAIDRNVNVLRALTGSSENAEKRLAELIATSQKTPGLTTALASTLDAQLRVANVTEQTINKVLPAIGRLNAVASLQDPQRFAQNLVQLVTQNFERIDLKELIGQSPLAGELIKQIFNVDSPINGEAIREAAQKMGLTSVEAFFGAFADAAAKNTKLANIGESLETQFQKLTDRVSVALRPLGTAILTALGPLVERGVIILEKIGKAFADLPTGLQQTIIVFTALTAAIGPAVIALGAFLQTAGAIGNIVTVFGALAGAGGALAGIGAVLAPLLPIVIALVAALGVAAIAWATYESAADRAAKVTVESVTAQAKQIDNLRELQKEAKSIVDSQAANVDSHTQLQSVLSKLDPDTRAYIGTIRDEKLAAVELNRVLAEQIQLRQQNLSRGFGDVGDAFGELASKASAAREQLSNLQKLSRELAASGGKNQGITFDPEQGGIFGESQLRRAEEFGAAIRRVEGEIRNLESAQSSLGKTVDAYLQTQNLSIDAFAQQQRAFGLTEDKVNALVSAYEAFKQAQVSARVAALDTANAVTTQAQSIDILSAAIDRLNKNVAGGEVDKVVKRIAATAKNTAEAKAKLRQELALNDDFFFAVQEENRTKANEAALKGDSTFFKAPKKASARGIENAARQDRGAEEAFQKARSKALLDIEEGRIREVLKIEKDSFDQRITKAESYYRTVEENELRLNDVARKRIDAEIAIARNRLAGAKAGTPEARREEAEILELQTRRRLIESERPDILRKTAAELRKLNEEAKNEALSKSLEENFRKTQKATEGLEQIRKLQRDKPQTDLRAEEIRLQGEFASGLIREQELTDGLILLRRQYRDAVIASLEAARAEAEARGEFDQAAQIEEQIKQQKFLGAELTRNEKLQKRFAEQGVIEYARLNEGVEDLLAEQKSLTEIFQDFRTNQVADAFGLIEKGVDKLTERLGVLGDAVGQLLKDLLKLAATSIFKQLFGIGSAPGQSPAFAGAPAGGGGGFNIGSLFGFGGGGNNNFLTGGFAGGNPAQQAIGGGSFGSGGNSPLGGLLRRIPGIGKLFGGAGSAAGAVGTVTREQAGLAGFGLDPTTTLGKAAGATQSSVAGGGFSSLLGGLGAGGLLAGGGFLGSLAGRGSPLGGLLGGIGGSLLGGVAGASGLFGGSIAGALPALFSNPITAIAGAALLGAAAIIGFFKNRPFNKFKKEVQKEFALKVSGDQQGKAVYEQIKEIGESTFGKGQFGKKIVDTIRMDEPKRLLAAYGELTGQLDNPLVKKFKNTRELTDINDPRNRFVRAATGAPAFAGTPLIVGDAGKPEVFVPRQNGYVFPSVSSASGSLGGGVPPQLFQVLLAAFAANTEALARLQSVPPGHVVQQGLRDNPEAATNAVATSFTRQTDGSRLIRDRVNTR